MITRYMIRDIVFHMKTVKVNDLIKLLADRKGSPVDLVQLYGVIDNLIAEKYLAFIADDLTYIGPHIN